MIKIKNITNVKNQALKKHKVLIEVWKGNLSHSLYLEY
jgi:hypothetical protein